MIIRFLIHTDATFAFQHPLLETGDSIESHNEEDGPRVNFFSTQWVKKPAGVSASRSLHQWCFSTLNWHFCSQWKHQTLQNLISGTFTVPLWVVQGCCRLYSLEKKFWFVLLLWCHEHIFEKMGFLVGRSLRVKWNTNGVSGGAFTESEMEHNFQLL